METLPEDRLVPEHAVLHAGLLMIAGHGIVKLAKIELTEPQDLVPKAALDHDMLCSVLGRSIST